MNLIEYAQQHKAAVGVASVWAVREWHRAWPYLKPSFSLPFLRENGGLLGIIKTVCTGFTPKPETQNKP